MKQMKRLIRDSYMLRLYFIAALLMGTFVSIYNYMTFRLESDPFSLSHVFIAFIFLMYTFGVLGTMITSRLSVRFEKIHSERFDFLFVNGTYSSSFQKIFISLFSDWDCLRYAFLLLIPWQAR
jgi:YNFM family putative membrane transporter